MTKLIVMLSLNIILNLSVNCYDNQTLYDQKYNWGKLPNYKYATKIKLAPMIILSIIISFKEKEVSAKSCAAKMHNKNLHSLFGNWKVPKTKTSLKIYQLNKGSSTFSTFKELIQMELNDYKADIAIYRESNVKKTRQYS